MKFLIVFVAAIGFSTTSMAETSMNCDPSVIKTASGPVLIQVADYQSQATTPEQLVRSGLVKVLSPSHDELSFAPIASVIAYAREGLEDDAPPLLMVNVQLSESSKALDKTPWFHCRLFKVKQELL